MGLKEILVLAFVLLFMGAMGALVVYSNTPRKEDDPDERKKT